MKKEAARTVSTIPVAPTTLYLAWLNPEQHAAMTNGGAAKIDGTVGAKYSSHGGFVSGKLLVLDLGRRIIVSWRTTDFPREATDSRVEIHLEALGAGTRVTVLHTEIPEGMGEKTKAYWTEQYLDPMRRYFSKYLPDPRLPPPPRPPPPPMDDDDDEEEEDEEEIAPKKGKKLLRPEKREERRLEKGPSVAKAPASTAALAPVGKPGKPSKPEKPAPPPPPAKAAKPAPKPAPAAKPEKKAPKPAPKPIAKKPAPKPAKKPIAKKPAPKPAKKPIAKKPAPKPAKKPAKPAPKKKR